MKNDLIEEDLKREDWNGELEPHICDACGEYFWGEIYDFGGKICKRCYEEVGNH